MVITCEPGLYLNKGSDAPARYRGIAIRIEDDVLITQQGPEIHQGCARERSEIAVDARLEVQIGIIGGGPVGSIASLALKLMGHTVRLFDPITQKPKMSLALSETTLSLLENIGVQPQAGQDLVEIPRMKRLARVDVGTPQCGFPLAGRMFHELDRILLGKSVILSNRWQ